MTFFTSLPTNFSETVNVVQDYIGGTYNNYIKTNYTIESVQSVKQSGLNIPYTLADVNNDGVKEIVIGALTGLFSVVYKIVDVSDIYQETLEATIFSDGIQNNYVLTKSFPITTVNNPVSGIIDGTYKNKIRVGTTTGKLNIDYVYDNGEINTIAKQIKKLSDENQDLRISMSNQYTTIDTSQKTLNVTNKFLSLYNRTYDFKVNNPNELSNYNNETTNIGTWSYATSANTYYYFAGNNAAYIDSLNIQKLNYQKEISTYSLLGNYYEQKEPSLTASTEISGNNGYYTIDKAVDGLLGVPYAFESKNINPLTIYAELPINKYITKIRINSTPNEEIQTITNVTICDSISSSGLNNPIVIFSGTKNVSNQFVEFYCQQNFNIKDENLNDLMYLPNKKIVAITLNRPGKLSVLMNEIEIYSANFTPEDLAYYNETCNLYNELLTIQNKPFGPNSGYDTVPPTGRATWYESRRLSMINRKTNFETFVSYFANQNIINQVMSEGDLLYVQDQKRKWRTKFDDTTKSYKAQNEVLNDNAIKVVSNDQQLIDYERYI